jgi:DNA-binding GntR family transcriptional regulator
MSSLPRVPSSSLRAQAYESFQQQIVAANIRPGQFISQRELMQLLGMPLGAVRELIPRLEAEGLLRTVPQRGLQIAHVDVKLVNNAFQLRLLLEREAAVRFAASVSDADLKAIADKYGFNVGLDSADDYVYLAPNRVNLQMAQERYPDIQFMETREIA